jgi:outer membrane protein TolC
MSKAKPDKPVRDGVADRRYGPAVFLAGASSLALVLLALAGCKGIPVKGEKEARQQAESVTAQYRPHGQKPSLPVLTTNSSLTDFVTYAMLNQPAVEAAYFDWLASVERITTARSLPDPQLTFQMDIQNIVTSVMPGVMMNFPGVGKLRAAGAVATAESQSKYFAFQTAVLQNAFEVKSAYYALYSLEEKIRVNRETLELLSELEKLARAQNDVGKVTLQDVLRAQIEQDRLKVDVANLEDSLGSARARFKAALGMGASEPMPPLPARAESSPLDLTSEKSSPRPLPRTPG